MESNVRTGRFVAALILLQMLGSAAVNFGLQAPLFGTPGFLEAAAPHATQIGESALLGILLGAIWLAIAIAVFPIVRRHSESLALVLVAISTVVMATAVVEQLGVMSMLSASEAYAKADAVGREQFQLMRPVLSSLRNWAHFTQLILSGCTMFVFYLTLLRFSLVPKLIPALGFAAVALQIASVARPYFGLSVIFPMLAPLGVTQLLLVLWLFAKGFQDVHPQDVR